MCIRFCWLMVLLDISILLIFHLMFPSIVERDTLKSPSITVDLNIYLFRSITFSLYILKLLSGA